MPFLMGMLYSMNMPCENRWIRPSRNVRLGSRPAFELVDPFSDVRGERNALSRDEVVPDVHRLSFSNEFTRGPLQEVLHAKALGADFRRSNADEDFLADVQGAEIITGEARHHEMPRRRLLKPD